MQSNRMTWARRWLPVAMTLTLASCSQDKPPEADEMQAEERLTRFMSKPQEDSKGEQSGAGTAMALDEGKMGKESALRGSGQYAMPGHYGAPASSQKSIQQARTAGVLGSLRGTIVQPDAPAQGNTEAYRDYGVNPMIDAADDRLSTFAIDVDTASYVIARRKIRAGTLPPPAAVRVEEFVNFFRYDYPAPTDNRPFSVHMDAAPSPLSPGRHILRVGVQAKKLSLRERKPVNLVFLVDVSGSMQSPDKLDLARKALRILVDNLRDGDHVALVTYAGNVRVMLEPTGLDRKGEIIAALGELSAGGSTAMDSGLQLAYDMAARNLKPNTVSRVIVLSDGDANVGRTSHEEILTSIAGHVKEGVTLSTVGFGMGNYKDELMEQLANKGNGNYYYIDGLPQARKLFQEQLGGTLEVVAKDVKIQVDMNPASVRRYRLIGYENRDIADRDFRDDRVDAGEIGAGHTVTAVYELELAAGARSPDVTVRIRAKRPRGEKATESAHAFSPGRAFATFRDAPADFRFAVAVMATAELLRQSEHARRWKPGKILDIARRSNPDNAPERRELVELLTEVKPLLHARRHARAD